MQSNTQIQAIEEEVTGQLEEIDVEQPSPVVEENEAVITTLSRILIRDRNIEEIERQRDFIKNQADYWAEQEVKKIEKQKAWLEVPLQSFMEAINKSNPKIKSLKFPVGKIGLRQSQQKIEIDADFVPADHKGEVYIREKKTYSVDKKGLMAEVKETGELPDYASVVPGQVSFFYKGVE